jgi:hypothetical protein
MRFHFIFGFVLYTVFAIDSDDDLGASCILAPQSPILPGNSLLYIVEVARFSNP